jgi:hypothetical protein
MDTPDPANSSSRQAAALILFIPQCACPLENITAIQNPHSIDERFARN